MRGVRPLLVAAVLASVVGACREHTVSVEFAPERGDHFRYRYEVQATLTRSVDGRAPEEQVVDTELTADQVVLGRSGDGTRVEIEVTRAGGARSTVVAVVDRAGSLEGIELVQGLHADVFGIGDDDGLVTDPGEGLPDRRLRPGDRWTLADGERRGHGRLERLGVADGHDVAVVRTSTTEPVEADGGEGVVTAGSLTSYDLDDGAVRSGRSWSHGRLDVQLDPPTGIEAKPLRATVTYDVEIRVVRV
jgi:hypothetical protein